MGKRTLSPSNTSRNDLGLQGGYAVPGSGRLIEGLRIGFNNRYIFIPCIIKKFINLLPALSTISSRLVDKFMKICAIMPSTGQDGYKKSQPSEVNLEKAVATPVFDLD